MSTSSPARAARASTSTEGRVDAAFGGGSPDDEQRAVIELDPTATGVVVGSAGTGKTETLLARAVRLIESEGAQHGELLVLAPTRQAATRLRDRLASTLRLPTSGPIARSVSAFAFQLVREAAARRAEAPPQLLSAGDHDALLAQLLAGDDELAGDWPETTPPTVRGSREFRTELRSLLAMASESGVDDEEWRRLADESGVPAWRSAARIRRDYDYALGASRTAHRDPATLVREAVGLVAAGSSGAVRALRVILVDDAQELTRGGVDLLAACHDRGIAVMAFADPDIASGSFRGASPALFAELSSRLDGATRSSEGAMRPAQPRTRFVLRAQHRSPEQLTEIVREVTTAIGASGTVEHRVPPRRGEAPTRGTIDDDPAVAAFIARSPFEEFDTIARTVREWHVMRGIPWSRIAIIAHDTRQVARLETELGVRDVPTRAVGAAAPLGEQSVVVSLLRIVELGLHAPAEREVDALVDALLSVYIGLDPLGVRRLRARLRIAEIAAGGDRRAADLLGSALRTTGGETERLSTSTPEGRAALRLVEMLRAIELAADTGASIHELCWTVWERSGLEQSWAHSAGGTGPAAVIANRSLDALVAVFGAAKRFSERDAEGGRATARRFIAEMIDSDIPDDVLTVSRATHTVSVLTPAAALGTEFDAVVVAGVQQGVWPNTRLRGDLLETWRFPDELARLRAGSPPSTVSVLDRRRDVLSEELRLFVRALSRARQRVLVTAVDDEDQSPSPLFPFLPPPSHAAPDGSALTLRGAVARHRRVLTSSPDAAARSHSAAQLALLAKAGVAGADPDEWYGIADPTTCAPLREPQHEPVRLSPSRLESFETCELDWALRALGGDPSSFSAGLGTVLHGAMESVPDGDLDELRAVVARRWGELEFEAEWIGDQERVWAEALTLRLHEYLRDVRAAGARAVGAEVRFLVAVELPAALIEAGAGDADEVSAHVAVPRVWAVPTDADPADVVPAGVVFALLSGSIDRVEVHPPVAAELGAAAADRDRVVVVDLKTGRSEDRLSDEKVVDDAQLAAYQAAVLSGAVPGIEAFQPGGARLVVISKTSRETPYRIAHQPAPDAEERARFLRRIAADAVRMASAEFTASVDEHCLVDRYALCRAHIIPPVSAS